MKPSDVGQQIHSYKQGSYKWDLVGFNHTSHEIIMTNIRDDLFRVPITIFIILLSALSFINLVHPMSIIKTKKQGQNKPLIDHYLFIMYPTLYCF